MKKLITKIETYENNNKIKSYYFLGKIPYLKKIKGITGRKTFLFNICISNHPETNVIVNSLNYHEILDVKNHEEHHILVEDEIDIIIPIYNGYEYLEDLFESIRKNTDVSYRLIVINDCSTDVRVANFLEKQKSFFQNAIQIINNEKNLGFVKSVNRALAEAKNDVVIVNTDVIVPQNWASRLMFPIKQSDKVASVTPFSNAATIFSLPIMGQDNIFDGNLEKVNIALRNIHLSNKEMKFATGVGFCMAMKKEVIDKIGFFDEIFEKGYGEENDWCQRAEKAGYINTISSNLFVWHKHGGSFAAEEKLKLIQNHIKIINNRYPDYNKQISKIYKDEDYLSLHFLAEILYFYAISDSTEVWWNHTWGGGAETYAQRKIDELKQQSLIIVLQEYGDFMLKCTYHYKNYTNHMFVTYDDIRALASKVKISKIVVNNLAGYKDITQTLEFIKNIKQIADTKVSFRVHDFQCICPNITMVNNDIQYCQCTNLKACVQCMRSFRKTQVHIKNIEIYQQSWSDFLQNIADEIIVFSQSTYSILTRIYKDIEKKIKIVPHQIPTMKKVEYQTHKGINICVIGNISKAKGASILKEIDKLFPKYKDVQVFIAGKSELRLSHTQKLGQYDVKDLPSIMQKNLIDIVLIPSIWPETFSYTTEEAMSMEIPVACYNIGAPAERVKNYKNGLIISQIDAQTTLNEIINFVNNLRKSNY